MAKINKDGKIDAPELLDSIARRTEAEEAAAAATEEATKLKEEEVKKDKKFAKLKLAGNKAFGKLSDKIEEATKVTGKTAGALEFMSGIIGDKTVKQLGILAGSAGIVTARMTKFGKEMLSIQRALPNFFNKGLGEAIAGMATQMAKTGLNAERFGSVVRSTGLAFRKHGDEIANSVQANEKLRLALDINREQFVTLTARSIMQQHAAEGGTIAQAKLNEGSVKYIMNLSRLALQTGRQADEVEDARIAASRSSAGFLATLSKQDSALFQQGELILQGAGDAVAEFFGRITLSGDVNQRMEAFLEEDMALRAIQRDNQIFSDEEFEKFSAQRRSIALTGQIKGNEESFAQAVKFAKFMGDLEGKIQKGPFAINQAQTDLQVAVVNFSRVLDKNGQTQQEAGKAQADGMETQVEAIKGAIGAFGKWGDAILQGTNLLSAFGGPIGDLLLAMGGIGLVGGGAGLVGAVMGVLGPLALFGIALLAIAGIIEKFFPGAIKDFIDDIFLGKAEADVKEGQKNVDKTNKITEDLFAKKLEAAGDDQEKREKVLREADASQAKEAEKRGLPGFFRNLFGLEGSSNRASALVRDDFLGGAIDIEPGAAVKQKSLSETLLEKEQLRAAQSEKTKTADGAPAKTINNPKNVKEVKPLGKEPAARQSTAVATNTPVKNLTVEEIKNGTSEQVNANKNSISERVLEKLVENSLVQTQLADAQLTATKKLGLGGVGDLATFSNRLKASRGFDG